MEVEAIDDTCNSEQYIADLEQEIDLLRKEVKRYKRLLNTKETTKEDLSCCDKYKLVVKSFHELLDSILPF